MMSQDRKQSKPLCSRFGTIAVELGFINVEQLKQALDEQVDDDLNGRPHRVLGAICFAQGWMKPEQIDVVLNHMFKARAKRSTRTEVVDEEPV
jgi:hypothetical protein